MKGEKLIMGNFSWVYSDTNRAIVNSKVHDSYVLVPKEFQTNYGAVIHEDCYDGYGHFGNYDIYELVAIWNKKFIPYVLGLLEMGEWTDTHIKKEDLINYYMDKPTSCELRDIGIWLACYDRDNERLMYPIKIVEDSTLNYDDVAPSKNDPNQGWIDWETFTEISDIDLDTLLWVAEYVVDEELMGDETITELKKILKKHKHMY